MGQAVKGICLDLGPITYSGASNNVVNFSDDLSFTELTDSLHVNVSANGGWGAFSASAQANFAREVKDDDYSRSFIFSSVNQFKTEQYNVPDDIYDRPSGALNKKYNAPEFSDRIV
ncbi:hypothetical protein A0O36_02898 [Piscirickettsiaceae bacterium NZ-RLO1]|nr:hypothetical protein A0O36_02898 [Piscirickettsiaceae bacterium NZ-RLO1]